MGKIWGLRSLKVTSPSTRPTSAPPINRVALASAGLMVCRRSRHSSLVRTLVGSSLLALGNHRAFMPLPDHEHANPPIPGRRAVLAAVVGAAGFAVTRASGASDKNFSKKVVLLVK